MALIKHYCRLFLLIVALLPLAAYADDPAAATDDEPFAATQKELADKGIKLQFSNITDVMADLSGGNKQGTAILNSIGGEISLDAMKAFNLEGVTAEMSFLQTNGELPNRSLVGALQRVDNMEPYHGGFEVYQVYVQKNWQGDKYSLLGGVYDLSNEFYSTDSSDLFLNYGLELGTELAATGNHGPAIFPTSSPSIRFKSNDEGWYLQTALSDGINGNPEDVRTESLRLSNHSNALLIGETGYNDKTKDMTTEKWAIGTWRYTTDIGNFIHHDSQRNADFSVSEGVYMLSEHLFYNPKPGTGEGLRGFFRIGFADSNASRVDYSWSSGMVYTGLIPQEEKGQLGFTVSQAHNSNRYLDSLQALGLDADKEETLFEFTYHAPILPWLSVQPDAQYIVNPDTVGDTKNAMVIGSRVEVDF